MIQPKNNRLDRESRLLVMTKWSIENKKEYLKYLKNISDKKFDENGIDIVYVITYYEDYISENTKMPKDFDEVISDRYVIRDRYLLSIREKKINNIIEYDI